MSRIPRPTILFLGSLAAFVPAARAQSLDDLKIQVHGFATQGFIYSSHNSWNTTDSEHGSFATNDTVLNVTAQPEPRLRIGVQARYFLLGDYGDKISLDWAQADFKVNERFGVRAGKVKTPSGLLNETQDIDPAHLWILLPQSIYPVASRTTFLSHYGAVFYGSFPIGERFGKLEYHVTGGNQSVPAEDGVLQAERDNGYVVPNGLTGKIYGGSLRWKPPLPGLLVGASVEGIRHTGEVLKDGTPGTFDSGNFLSMWYFAQYERANWMIAAEYNRFPPNPTIYLPGQPPNINTSDARNWYVMASHRVGQAFNLGAYYSYTLDLLAPLDGNRYQKDWTLSSRYDLNPYVYLKLEQHFVNGTQVGFSSLDNANLKTRFNMSLFRFGVSF